MMDERGKRLLVEILLVEDNPSDVLLTQIAMKECKIANRCTSPTTARRRSPSCAARASTPTPARPDLVLLDLNLPKMDGRELLREMKSDPGLRTIPVVVLTDRPTPRPTSCAATTCTPTRTSPSRSTWSSSSGW
jgi:CheY-like chemotaxis protein